MDICPGAPEFLVMPVGVKLTWRKSVLPLYVFKDSRPKSPKTVAYKKNKNKNAAKYPVNR